jgi:enoyl-CoA hydratase/carnithine racemase
MAEESTASLVEYACKDQVATLTLNRPQRLNAFSDELVRHLADALRRFDLDPEAQVAVICGNGRAFSSGADVHQRQLRKREEFLEHGGPQGWGANSGDLLTGRSTGSRSSPRRTAMRWASRSASCSNAT